MDERAGFTPLRGSDPRMLAVALVDGRCAYLSDDDRCRIHASAGEAEKPLGCRTYPARFVDDGVSVRISPWIECACVLASAQAREGSPLVDASLRVRRDLDSAIYVEPLPPVVHVGRADDASPGDVARWSLALREVRVADGCASLLALARALDANGLDVEASRRALASPEPPDEHRLRIFLEAVLPRARRFADVGWRSERDLARTTAAAIAAATELALASLSDFVAPSPRFAADEAFYVRALVFGHQLCHPRRTMAVVATDRAARVVLARSLAVVAALTEQRDAAFSRPLALVEATMRAYGLSAYVPDAEAALAAAEAM
jgi:lysine-N-methylase